MNGSLAKFVALGDKLGGDVAEISHLAHATFVSQQQMMSVVPLTQKPGDKVFHQLVEATSEGISAVQVPRSCRLMPCLTVSDYMCPQ